MGGHEDEDLNSVQDALDDFDAEQCSCHAAEDKHRMLEIVYAAFGSTSAFNASVRDMFRNTRLLRSRDDLSITHTTTIKSDPTMKSRLGTAKRLFFGATLSSA